MKETSIKTPVKDLKTDDTIEHRKVILLEDIQSKMEQVIEGMCSTKESIHKEISEFRVEVNQRFDMIETVVRAHSGQLQNVEKDIKDIKLTVHRLEEKDTNHEERITVIEREMHP